MPTPTTLSPRPTFNRRPWENLCQTQPPPSSTGCSTSTAPSVKTSYHWLVAWRSRQWPEYFQARTPFDHGWRNEDWLRVLRVRQVLDADGGVLFDEDEGHDDEAAEQAIDLAGTEYLDLLMDFTGDEYLGAHQLVTSPERAPPRWHA